MAQLRDVRTSEVIFEGTALECVVHAGELGGAALVGIGEQPPAGVEVIYDGVGVGFDPVAVLEAAQQTADGLTAAAKDERDPELDDRAARAKAELEADPASLKAASAELEAARARLDS